MTGLLRRGYLSQARSIRKEGVVEYMTKNRAYHKFTTRISGNLLRTSIVYLPTMISIFNPSIFKVAEESFDDMCVLRVDAE